MTTTTHRLRVSVRGKIFHLLSSRPPTGIARRRTLLWTTSSRVWTVRARREPTTAITLVRGDNNFAVGRLARGERTVGRTAGDTATSCTESTPASLPRPVTLVTSQRTATTATTVVIAMVVNAVRRAVDGGDDADGSRRRYRHAGHPLPAPAYLLHGVPRWHGGGNARETCM